jgi:hypothetical protein
MIGPPPDLALYQPRTGPHGQRANSFASARTSGWLTFTPRPPRQPAVLTRTASVHPPTPGPFLCVYQTDHHEIASFGSSCL